jgi:glycosyltransferase involved in cell wall biosynthesis
VRLLHLSDRHSARGGADWHLLGVLEAQVTAGHEVHLAAGRADGSAPPDPPFHTHLLTGLDAREGRAVPGLDELVRRLAPDLIHVHNVVNPDLLHWAAALQQRLPCVMTVQDHRAFCPGRGMWTAAGEVCAAAGPDRRACAACFDDPAYFEAILALTSRRLAAVRQLPLTVLSCYMKARLSAAGVPAAQIHVIPPFVHGLQRDARPDGPPCILFAGRLTASKGVAAALEAWKHADPDLPLVIAGTGPERSHLRLDRRPGCQVLGWVPHQRMSGLYRRAAVLLLPSRWQEPFGIVGLEALTLGVPVAAWDSGGVRDWHPGPGAGLVPWGDVEGLARAARELAGGRAGGRAGERARPPRGFERAAVMARLEALYRSLIAPGR